MPPLLEIHDLRKSFGTTAALDGVSFHVDEKEIFGLLGPNGAGKTTLLSIVACLSAPTAGQVFLDGQALRRDDLRQRRLIGIGTQDLAIYSELSARENLRFFGKLYGLSSQSLEKRIDEVLELAGLIERANDRAGTFSGGMKRRLNLGIAVMHRPRLLLLDEPTAGVDPQSRHHIFERVRDLNTAGTTIIYTSHYMEEVQTLCKRIGILDHGKLIACDTLPNLLQMLEGTVKLRLASDPATVRQRLEKIPGVRVASASDNTLSIASADVSATLREIVRVLKECDVELRDLEIMEPNLERVFLHLTERTLRD
jgi:linearmycin/streptolysin S transport system ATP-binding protein